MNDSIIVCACGLRCEGTPKQALAMYRSHTCRVHDAESGSSWADVAGWAALLVFLSFVCTQGWGMLN